MLGRTGIAKTQTLVRATKDGMCRGMIATDFLKGHDEQKKNF